MTFPNSLPRPDDELDTLERVWQPPSGWSFITVVNNTYIGLLYVGTAFLFFLLAGILALMMRSQLAVPGNNLLSQDLYNQLFTMHGTIMMFLFAVPAVEALGVLLLPNMQAARDLPFPRLSAYAFWAYAVGGLVFFGSLFFGLAPKGGWFMYPPLTSYEYSPGHNADFWLLGIGFIEISAIAGAVEIVVGVLRTRAPGMSLDKMPVYCWAMLVFAGMIIFAFPAVILGTALLKLERSFQWPFFIAEKGGDPLLWQHLFWFFGHPEVYIIFLPPAGMVSMILPTAVFSMPSDGPPSTIPCCFGTTRSSRVWWDLQSSTSLHGSLGEALMARVRFTSATLRVLSGLMIWAAHFLVIYVFTALACARHFADLSWLGIGVVPWVIGTATLAAATTMLVVIGLAVRDARLNASRNNISSFVPWMSAALGGLALMAILWEALPVLLVQHAGKRVSPGRSESY